MLLVFDETNEECTVLYINRDTMLDMDVLGVMGEYAGTAYGQVALAHTYGQGLDDSCENMKNTLMKFIHGMTIDYYVAMNMDAIPILNDAVGGVTVNVVDDFSNVNPSITMGELTLRGDQVIDFVRTRKNVGDQTNVTRMERQKAYVAGFLEQLYAKEHEDINFLVNMYDDIAPYLVSDCPVSTLSNMLDRYVDYEIKEVVTPEGENLIGDGHYEFYVDEEQFDGLIVRLFYAPKR
jgi:LCP family protein required for cell wall assembly